MGEQLNVPPAEHPHVHQIDHRLHHSALDLSINLSSNSCGSAWSDDDLDLMGNIAAAMESALFTKNPSDASQHCDTEHSYEQYIIADYLNANDRYEAMNDHDEALINGAADAIVNDDDHDHNYMLNTGSRTINDHINDDLKQYDHESNNVSDLLAFAHACTLSTSSTNLITKTAAANYSKNQAAAAANPVLNHAANQRRRMNSNMNKAATTGSTIVSVSSTTAGYKLSDFLEASRRIFKPINIYNNGCSTNPAINNRFNLRSSHSSSDLLMTNSSSTILKRTASMIMSHGNDSNLHDHSNVGHVDQAAAAAADDRLLQFTTHVVSESVRRKQMTRLFHTLRSLLPTTTPRHDRCTIIDETCNYIQTLERELKGLKKKRFVLEIVDQLLQTSSSGKPCTKGDLMPNKEASKDCINKHDHNNNHDHNHVSSINKQTIKLVEDMIDNDELMKELEQEAPYIQVLGNYDGDYVRSEVDQSKAKDPSSPSSSSSSSSSPPSPSSVSISIGFRETKRGLFPTILHLVEQHNLELISANQSHNNDIVLYAIYAKVCQPHTFAIDPNRLKAELYAHAMVFML